VDRRFTVLFVLPADHLAYAWADKPTAASYAPIAAYSSNPAGSPVAVTRQEAGVYKVVWTDLASELLGAGNVQVTAYGGNAQCKFFLGAMDGALVRCFAPNGPPADSRFTVLRGS
jgi:hypothetical protein